MILLRSPRCRQHRPSARTAQALRQRGFHNVTHLLCIGGWDAPHPATQWTGHQWADAWQDWNQNVASRPALGFHGFDGIDWDLEGNDAPASPWNTFTVPCLDLVGTMSQRLKQQYGRIVTLVPPQSYFDVETTVFDRSLLHADEPFPHFSYHGRNAYAALPAKYGVETFDLVDIQLYESFSRAKAAVDFGGMDPAVYLAQWATALAAGWTVDFSTDSGEPGGGIGLNNTMVQVDASRLIVGLSRGGGKSWFVWPKDVGRAFAMLTKAGHTPPRGAMYWNIQNDGGPVNGTTQNCSLVDGLNSFLQVRRTT